MRVLLLGLVLAGCATASLDDDGEAMTGQAIGGPTLAGVFRSHATSFYSGDIPSVDFDGGDYVRARCYRASCALRVPETDHFDTYTSSSGKAYVRFYASGAIADVYEVATSGTRIKLRKAYSTRWQVLYATTAAAACTASGGSWGTDCTCGAGQEFVAGAGGCIATPAASEANCDASGGQWTDDDATKIGSYCVCGVGRYLDATGSCADI